MTGPGDGGAETSSSALKRRRRPEPSPTQRALGLLTRREHSRKELVRKAHDLAENARNAVRQARRDGNERLKKMEREHEIGQDDERRGHDEIQKIHDRFIAEIQQVLEHKEKDILAV